ncbi:Carboxy-terminal domain (CTD) phosphatase [Physocladia obscura]|uniref:protein-serine/threonine phosphatase n=1 Tax=Physocladia obscura TaxID=109957 RepID=A0AAD5SX62_9FUNG|nr:Carboxy-terminal domain (CTD) phosphatase [Physocladia obscura]
MHDNDSELSDIMSRLEKIHESFYNKLKRRGGDGSDYISSEVDADVRRVMDVIRSRVLAGCELVFSAVVPLGFDIKRHEAYRFAIMFGAKVADEVTESTTHVIAAKLGTDKVMKGFRTNGVSIVSPDWLYRVAFAWRRLPEAPYALPRPTIPKDANSDVNYAAPASNSATDFDESTEEVFVNIDGIDWGDMDAEVDEAMNESDDDVEDLNTDQTVETEFDGGIGGVGGEIEEDEGAEDWDTLEGEIEGYLDADSHADESGSEASIEFTNRKRKRRATESPKSSPKK